MCVWVGVMSKFLVPRRALKNMKTERFSHFYIDLHFAEFWMTCYFKFSNSVFTKILKWTLIFYKILYFKILTISILTDRFSWKTVSFQSTVSVQKKWKHRVVASSKIVCAYRVTKAALALHRVNDNSGAWKGRKYLPAVMTWERTTA
jgi:hypothetical protein